MFGGNYDHKTIRIYNAVFGSLFNNLNVIREDGKDIPVPISYGSGAKHFLAKRDSDVTNREVAITLPRMSYVMEALNHDVARQGNKTQILRKNTSYQYGRVPYDFIYTLSIKTKTLDEGNEIIEQILPYFTPTLSVRIKDSVDLDIVSTVQVRLDSVQPQDSFEGSLEESRELEWTLSFNMKGWLYQKSKTGVLIKEVTVDIGDYSNPLQSQNAIVDPITATETDPHTIVETTTIL